MLKYKADLKTISYLLIIALMFAGQWVFGFNIFVYIIYLHFAVAISVITHNHNHVSIWTNKWLNILTDWWLTVFYGMPIFAWIPTHNRNHHRHVNKIEDVTRTYRHREQNDLVALVQYPSISGYNQMKEGIIPYMKELKEKNREQYIQNLLQIAVLVIWTVGFFILDWKKALLYVLLPQQISQMMVIIFNYVQHADADEESEFNHSRNFMWVNWFLFNNGYHTAHHHRASMHWSEAAEAHKKIAHKISPHLIENSFWGYIFRTYFLSILIPSYRSKPMRTEHLAMERQAVKQVA